MTPETPLKYLGDFEATLRDDNEKPLMTLLWGDRLHILDISGSKVHVKARGKEGWLRMSSISSKNLLEIYMIDVGQGDSVLMKTPDDKWHIIDAGAPSVTQGTRKGAANFLRWKFMEDLGLQSIPIINVRAGSLDGIWRRSPVFSIFRDIKRGDLKGKCRDCEFLGSLCFGGCRAAALSFSGNLYAEDPMCWKDAGNGGGKC